APYLEALRAHAGNSCCILVGHCFAGLIAFELGRRYEEAGGKVDTVVLLDSQWPVGRIPAVLRDLDRIWSPHQDGKSPFSEGTRIKNSLLVLRWMIKDMARKALQRVRQRFIASPLAGLRDENGRFVELPVLDRIYDGILATYARRPMNASGLLV